jgi:hypothetical protein
MRVHITGAELATRHCSQIAFTCSIFRADIPSLRDIKPIATSESTGYSCTVRVATPLPVILFPDIEPSTTTASTNQNGHTLA